MADHRIPNQSQTHGLKPLPLRGRVEAAEGGLVEQAAT